MSEVAGHGNQRGGQKPGFWGRKERRRRGKKGDRRVLFGEGG